MAFFDVLSFVFEWCCFVLSVSVCDMLRIVEMLCYRTQDEREDMSCLNVGNA